MRLVFVLIALVALLVCASVAADDREFDEEAIKLAREERIKKVREQREAYMTEGGMDEDSRARFERRFADIKEGASSRRVERDEKRALRDEMRAAQEERIEARRAARRGDGEL